MFEKSDNSEKLIDEFFESQKQVFKFALKNPIDEFYQNH